LIRFELTSTITKTFKLCIKNRGKLDSASDLFGVLRPQLVWILACNWCSWETQKSVFICIFIFSIIYFFFFWRHSPPKAFQ